MDSVTSNAGRAIWLDPRRELDELSDEQWRALKSRFEFILVSSREAYNCVANRGLQPVLPSMSFSETDERGRARALLGPLHRSWRWRRYLMNERISRLWIERGPGMGSVVVGALIGGARFNLA